MELRHLRYFIAVAEAGSLTLAAAKRLNTAQPSLSRQIRALEEEVGARLIARSVHGVELTPAGRAFLDHARLAVTQAEAAKEAARKAAQPTKTSLALGFLSGTEMELLPKVMHILQADLPNIEVKLWSDYSPKLADGLLKGRLDAAFMRPEPLASGLVYKRVRTEPLIVVFPRHHRLAMRKSVRLRDLRDERLLMPSRTAPTLRKVIEDSLVRHGLDIRADHDVHNLSHAFSMVASTGGVTILPAYARNYFPASVTGRPIQGDAPTVDLVMAYHEANNSHNLKLLLSGLDHLYPAA
jgi:LysR family transcriptional regulator, hca operon transcriptional activator